MALWAADCAERVLVYFEEKHPDGCRPRNAIEAGCVWACGELKMTDARKTAFASHAAVRDAFDDSAVVAARACGYAAAIAHIATHAIYAATYAARTVGYAKKDISEERDWQYNHLLELYKGQKAKTVNSTK